jgi:hypothetical protein
MIASLPHSHAEICGLPSEPFSWLVERMRLGKDKSAVDANRSLPLTGIPPFSPSLNHARSARHKSGEGYRHD